MGFLGFVRFNQRTDKENHEGSAVNIFPGHDVCQGYEILERICLVREYTGAGVNKNPEAEVLYHVPSVTQQMKLNVQTVALGSHTKGRSSESKMMDTFVPRAALPSLLQLQIHLWNVTSTGFKGQCTRSIHQIVGTVQRKQ